MNFEWTTTDPTDEWWCCCKPLSCHVEKMADAMDSTDPEFDPLNDSEGESWYCAVYANGYGDKDAPSRSQAYRDYCLFHSSSDDILPLTGEAAKQLCELVMREWFARHPEAKP